MRTAQDELATWVAGRWSVLVRTLTLLGAPPHRAEDVAVEALARLGATWADRDQWPDLEVRTAEVLREAWAEDRSAWWLGPAGSGAGSPEPVQPVQAVQAVQEVPEVQDPVAALEPELDLLDVSTRWRLVLEAVTGLAPEQVDDVLAGAPPPAPVRAGLAEAVALAALAVRVPPAPRTDVTALGRRRRRGRAWATAALVGVLVVAIAGGASYVAVRTQGNNPAPGAAPARPATSSGAPDRPRVPRPVGDSGSVPVAWWAAGTVNQGDLSVVNPSVSTLHAVADGVVVEDDAGRLTLLAPDIRQRPLGRAARDGAVRTSGTDVAFVNDRHQLVVLDVASRGHLLRHRLGPGDRLVALDDRLAYVTSPGGRTTVLVPAAEGGGGSLALGGRLLDVRAGVVAVRRPDGRIEVRAGSREPTVVPGAGLRLSPDGRRALVLPGTGSHGAGRPAPYLLDTTTGEASPLPLQLSGSAEVVDATFGPDDSVTVVVARAVGDEAEYFAAAPPPPGRTYDLVTCSDGRRSCALDVRVLGVRTPPVLAH